MLSNSQLELAFLHFLNKLSSYTNESHTGYTRIHLLLLLFASFCSLILKPLLGPLTFVTLRGYSFWHPRLSQFQKCQLTSGTVISVTMVTKQTEQTPRKWKSRALSCAPNIQCLMPGVRLKRARKGPSEVLAGTRGTRGGGRSLRSQSSALECWLLSF